MAYRRIIAALDRSSQDETVFAQSLELAKLSDGELLLFHCISVIEEDEEGRDDLYEANVIDFTVRLEAIRREWEEKHREQTQQWMQSYLDRAKTDGVRATSQCVVGEIDRTLPDIIEHWSADLVVIGRRHHRGLKALLWGDIRMHWLDRIPCAILVANSPDKR
ncbi:MAG: universal stress protein [Cyanobacteria bacterium SID2]|nr:universal stress protein [Cyanobacteria bacterium SID2]MBP0004176.1 universal stress protein [Cyanobacteria bacterium SBC]